MARPKLKLPDAEAIRALADEEGRLSVRVTPGAKVEALDVNGGKLTMKVRAKPKDGEANDAVVKLLAQALGCAPSRLELIGGQTSREKRIQIGCD